MLSIMVPYHGSSDIRVWSSCYSKRVRAANLHDMYREEPARCMDGTWVWTFRVHLKVRLLLWKVAWDCLPTRAVLRGRGVDLLLICPWCQLEEERGMYYFCALKQGRYGGW